MIKINDKKTKIEGSLGDIIPEIISLLKATRDILSKCGFSNDDFDKLLKLAVKVSKFNVDELKSGCGAEEMAAISKLTLACIARKLGED